MFEGQASRLAEHCGRITAKEAAKREGVLRQLKRHVPLELLAKAGLLQEPPHCTVSTDPAVIAVEDGGAVCCIWPVSTDQLSPAGACGD